MKLNKILLAIPALTSVVIPLASCHHNDDAITITINDSEKEITTPSGFTIGCFTLHSSSPLDAGDVAVTKLECTGTLLDGNYVKVDEDDKSIVYLYVWFDESVTSGESSIFDVELQVKKKYTSRIEGLKITYYSESSTIPESKLNIDGTILKGLKDDCETNSYDTLAIPASVTEIAADAFNSVFTSTKHVTIKNIIFNKSVTKIGKNAFKGCEIIEYINISNLISSNAIPTIGDSAFDLGKDEGTIEYGSSLTYSNPIDYALCDSGLAVGWFDTSAVRPIPSSDLKVESQAIKANWTRSSMSKHITKLCNVLDMSSFTDVTAIAENGFYDATNNVSLIPDNIITLGLPKNLKYIRKQALRGCPCTLFLNPTTSEASVRFVLPSSLLTIAAYGCADFTNLYFLDINEGTHTLSEGAFANNKLYGIIIPSTLTTIETKAFAQSPNLSSIDVTSATWTSVPSTWSTTDTFTGLPDQGWISCAPSTATTCQEYFAHFVTISTSTWQITDALDLLKTYTPQITPATGGIYQSLDVVMNMYKTQLKSTTEGSLTLFDDLIWTVQKHLNTSDYAMFNLSVNHISYYEMNDTLSFMLSYSVKFKNETTVYRGYVQVNNMNISDVVSYTQDAEGKYVNIQFSNIFKQQAIIIDIWESDLSGYEFEATYKQNKQPKALSEATLGKILNKLGLFKIVDSKIVFELRSSYMRNCRY